MLNAAGSRKMSPEADALLPRARKYTPMPTTSSTTLSTSRAWRERQNGGRHQDDCPGGALLRSVSPRRLASVWAAR